jgi:hypothetical protein
MATGNCIYTLLRIHEVTNSCSGLNINICILVLWRVSVALLLIVDSGLLALVTTLSYYKYKIVVAATHDQL